MAQLIAIGKNARHRCACALEEGETILLGRAPRQRIERALGSADFARARPLCAGGRQAHRLRVGHRPQSRSLFGGRPAKQFDVESQGEFLIGETRFQFDAGEARDDRRARRWPSTC